jgi:hypothetical protein
LNFSTLSFFYHLLYQLQLTMGNHRSGPSSASASMVNSHSAPSSTSASGKARGSVASKRGKPASKKASPAQKRASTDNQENPGLSEKQWALYKNLRSKLVGKQKAVVVAAEDEGMSSILFLQVALVHIYFISYPNEKPKSTR